MPVKPLESYTLSDFDYDLPAGLIAKYPLPERDQSRMLVLNRQEKALSHQSFIHFPQFLEAGDLVVLNNAKVIPARLLGHREGYTGQVEIFLMHPQNHERTHWQVLMRPAKRLKAGSTIVFEKSDLKVTVLEQQSEGRGLVSLQWPSSLSLEEILEQTGQLPIPPYLEREAEAIDTERYQTIFAKVSGAQAAPTAGLHFTPQVLEALQQRGVQLAEITLHVSAGTFRPVLSETISHHQMDPEFYTISEETAQAIEKTKANGHRVIAIGTTVAKTLETSAYRHHGNVQPESDWSDLFITPGFQFQVVSGLLTNFHLPKSTLLMMICAFANNRDLVFEAYTKAVEAQYRFYSYGDCMLLL